MIAKKRKQTIVFSGIVFFKNRARQLLKLMFFVHDLHWIAAVLNPRTRMPKMATDAERYHAHGLVCSRITQIIETDRVRNNQCKQSIETITPSSSAPKKFKSYTA